MIAVWGSVGWWEEAFQPRGWFYHIPIRGEAVLTHSLTKKKGGKKKNIQTKNGEEKKGRPSESRN